MTDEARKWETVETDGKGKARMDDVTICRALSLAILIVL